MRLVWRYGAKALSADIDAPSLPPDVCACTNLGVEMKLARRGAREEDVAKFADEAFAINRLIDNNPVRSRWKTSRQSTARHSERRCTLLHVDRLAPGPASAGSAALDLAGAAP